MCELFDILNDAEVVVSEDSWGDLNHREFCNLPFPKVGFDSPAGAPDHNFMYVNVPGGRGILSGNSCSQCMPLFTPELT